VLLHAWKLVHLGLMVAKLHCAMYISYLETNAGITSLTNTESIA
jgi:hypothetical protein